MAGREPPLGAVPVSCRPHRYLDPRRAEASYSVPVSSPGVGGAPLVFRCSRSMTGQETARKVWRSMFMWPFAILITRTGSGEGSLAAPWSASART